MSKSESTSHALAVQEGADTSPADIAAAGIHPEMPRRTRAMSKIGEGLATRGGAVEEFVVAATSEQVDVMRRQVARYTAMLEKGGLTPEQESDANRCILDASNCISKLCGAMSKAAELRRARKNDQRRTRSFAPGQAVQVNVNGGVMSPPKRENTIVVETVEQ